MIPAHDGVALTERERAEFARLGRSLAVPASSQAPATLLTVGLLAMVAGSAAVSPAVLVAGIGLALAGLGRALRSGPRAFKPGLTVNSIRHSLK